MDAQPRVTDLVPRSPAVYVLGVLAGLVVVGALEGLYFWMPSLEQLTTDGRVATFDLDGEGSLCVWFSSVLLLASSIVAMVVYSVRRHRADDYQGRYRIWIWAALVWLVMSIDETASLHEGFKNLMVAVTGTGIVRGDGSIWWVIAYGFVLGSLGSRLILEMRECPASTIALLVAGGSFGLAVLAQLGAILPESGARGIALEEGLEMLGDILLLLAMTLHARYVILDAEGQIAHAEPAPTETKRAARKPRASRSSKAQPARAAGSETSPSFEFLDGAKESDEEAAESAEDGDQPEDEAEDEVEEVPSRSARPAKVHPPHGVRAPSRSASTRNADLEDEADDDLPSHVDEEVEAASALVGKPLHQLTRAERKALRKRLAREREMRQQEEPTPPRRKGRK